MPRAAETPAAGSCQAETSPHTVPRALEGSKALGISDASEISEGPRKGAKARKGVRPRQGRDAIWAQIMWA